MVLAEPVDLAAALLGVVLAEGAHARVRGDEKRLRIEGLADGEKPHASRRPARTGLGPRDLAAHARKTLRQARLKFRHDCSFLIAVTVFRMRAAEEDKGWDPPCGRRAGFFSWAEFSGLGRGSPARGLRESSQRPAGEISRSEFRASRGAPLTCIKGSQNDPVEIQAF